MRKQISNKRETSLPRFYNLLQMKKLFQVLANSSGECVVGFLLFEKLQTLGSKFNKRNSTMDVSCIKRYEYQYQLLEDIGYY